MATITPGAAAVFREQGYVVIPAVLDDAQLARGRELIAGSGGWPAACCGLASRRATGTAGARACWRQSVTDPLAEFRSAAAAGGS